MLAAKPTQRLRRLRRRGRTAATAVLDGHKKTQATDLGLFSGVKQSAAGVPYLFGGTPQDGSNSPGTDRGCQPCWTGVLVK